jgi:hypothetical protein
VSCFTPPAIYLRGDHVGIRPSTAGHAGNVSETSRFIELAPIHIARAPILRPGLPLATSLATHAVAIGTMHAPKGLEFGAAALVGCDSRHMPLSVALACADGDDTRRPVEERERHLLYVGCTRPRKPADHLRRAGGVLISIGWSSRELTGASVGGRLFPVAAFRFPAWAI